MKFWDRCCDQVGWGLSEGIHRGVYEVRAFSSTVATEVVRAGALVISGSILTVRVIAKKVSDTFDSVDGLSACTSMAVSISALVAEISAQQDGGKTKKFTVEEYESLIGATRIFQYPHYFLTTLWKDFCEYRFFSIASKVLGVATCFVEFAEWLRDHGRPELWKGISTLFKTRSVAWKVGLSGASLGSSICAVIEDVRDIFRGHGNVHAILNVIGSCTDISGTILSMIPAYPVLPVAILDTISAGIGLVSYFTDPEK